MRSQYNKIHAQELRKIALDFQLPIPVDLLVVDDNSPDGTGKIADELAAKNPSDHILHRAEKNALGRAYCAGFSWALHRDYEFIMEMDGDFSHNSDDIPRFIEAAQNADLVLGSRYGNGIRVINWPLKRCGFRRSPKIKPGQGTAR